MPKTKQFTDLSQEGPGGAITAWHWDFGDGNTSTSENPTHDYSSPGVYDVQLTITSPDGTDDVTKSVTVSIANLVAFFSAAPSDLDVVFTDHSTPGDGGAITDWNWDFGDGNSSTSESPSHTYADPGVYSVTLTVTSPDGTDEITQDVTVSVASTLTALFNSTISDLLVDFVDHSTPGSHGPITAYDWDFGDGTAHGTTANPTHKYTAAGTYTVTLTVTGTSPDTTAEISQDISVSAPVVTGGTIFDEFIAHSNFARPAFTPTRIVRFHDKATLDAALADLTAGDYVKYDPNFFGLSNQKLTLGKYSIRNKSMSKRTVIDFGCSHNVWDSSKLTPNYVAFSNTAVKDDAFLFADNKNLDIWGGDFYSAHGGDFRIMGNITDCQILDAYAHDAGGAGFNVQPIDVSSGATRTQDGLVIRGEINRFSMDPSVDGHPQKGTGLHGAIHHGACGKLDNSHFYYYAHDSLKPGEISFGTPYPAGGGGSACEAGTDSNGTATSQDNNHYCVYGENLNMDVSKTNPGDTGIKQTAGNIMNNWGSVPMNGMVCDFIGGKKITGAVMHGAGGNWHAASPAIKVLVGRGEQTNLIAASGGTERYVSGKGITYVDCT